MVSIAQNDCPGSWDGVLHTDFGKLLDFQTGSGGRLNTLRIVVGVF